MKFLVTGGTGFIGRRLVERLVSSYGAGAVTCLVLPGERSTDPPQVQLQSLGVRILEGDLCDPAVSRECAPEVTVVFHLAANIDTAACMRDLRVNDEGTTHLLDWLKATVRGFRLIHTSSVAVLDREGPAPCPLSESSPCTPRTAYGQTKLRAEDIIQTRAAVDGFGFTILRLGTIYGPGAKRGGLFESLARLTARDSLRARLDWPGRVSVMHVDDVVSVLVAVATDPRAANEIYCAANPNAPTVGELAQRIGRLSGRPVRVLRMPDWSWAIVRRLTWQPVVRLAASALAPQLFWRFSLIVDHSFWLDTTKLRSVWHQAPKDLDAGLVEMLTALAQEVSRFS
jgi:nucleoside-diphosphate-sugar epimerase